MLFATISPSLTRNLTSPSRHIKTLMRGSAKRPHSGRRKRRKRRRRKGGSQLSLTTGSMAKISSEKSIESSCTFALWFWKARERRARRSWSVGSTARCLRKEFLSFSSCFCSLRQRLQPWGETNQADHLINNIFAETVM